MPDREPKTDQELRQLAIDIEGGSVFTDRHIPPDERGQMLFSVFMILGLMTPEQAKFLNDVSIIYEYMHKASDRGIDGYPCFLSMQYLTIDEGTKLNRYIDDIRAFKAGTEEVPT